jgi:hypothetical protein
MVRPAPAAPLRSLVGAAQITMLAFIDDGSAAGGRRFF